MRPTTLILGQTLSWVLRTYNSSGVLVDADATPSVAVRKNGSAVGDSVTVTKRTSTTGIYDCAYNPSDEAEGDQFTLEESVTIASTAYSQSFSVTVLAVMRGTDSAATAGTAMALTSGERDTLTAQIEAALVNEGDATALLQAIADKIAGDLTAGDLSALAIVSAIKADATLAQMISRIDAAVSSRLAGTSYTAPPSASDIWSHETRTLSGFGTLVNDIWAHATRSITGLTQAALALFATTNTGETSAANGSVAKLAQGAGGGGEVIYSPAAVLPAVRPQQHLLRFFRGEFGFPYSFTVTGHGITGTPKLVLFQGATVLQQAEPTRSGDVFTFTVSADLTATESTAYEWNLWDVTVSAQRLVGYGPAHVLKAKAPT